MRPTISTVEPAVNGITALIGRDGQDCVDVCAKANFEIAGVANAAADKRRKWRRLVIRRLPGLYFGKSLAGLRRGSNGKEALLLQCCARCRHGGTAPPKFHAEMARSLDHRI